MSGKFFIGVPIAMLAIGGSTACATKKFVKTSVGQVNDKVDSLGRSVEETQERTRQNEGKIADVDQRAQAAARSAHSAADEAAGAASAANNTATAAASSANAAGAKADAVDKASKRLVFQVVLSDEQGNFKFAKTELPDEVKARLDESRSRQAVSVRASPDSAAQDQRDQLWRGEAGRAEQHEGRPREEPPRRHQGDGVTKNHAGPWQPVVENRTARVLRCQAAAAGALGCSRTFLAASWHRGGPWPVSGF